MDVFGIENVLNIITSISILAVVAVGLYIIFGLMQVINMAHGDMVMLGAYVTLVLTQAEFNFWIAALLAALIVGLIGGLIERGVVQFLYKSGNLSTMLATWGVSIMLQQIVKLIFGPQGQFVDVPIMSMTNIFGVDYPTYRLVLLMICIAILATVFFLLKKTRIGLLVRATMDNTTMAEAMGISTKQVYFFGFIGGSALAGFAGALLSPIANISPLMGLDYVTKSFLVVVIGGVESMLSAVGGSAIIAGIQNLLNNFMDATQSWIIILVIVIITTWIRPQGVFSKR
ncbi:branched-chain amino acid ABC transporter permease [Brevibacillus massiliensis]|uniref:branched-chain amino acid ABC transporter permease n=1 Tax=Brevibacillus massiliensis TaxID=1118054 RepID=UPI0002D870EA|nr:branched-chain amino acid ABC transporter permease [Brevibacillus massiliensis]